MAAGVPVVDKRISTNPEVGHDAVLYHENGDAAGAARQIEALLKNEHLWYEYQSLGTARVADLTWERHWHAIKASYRAVLNRN